MNRALLFAVLLLCFVTDLTYCQSPARIYAAQFDDARKLVYACNPDGSGADTMSMPLRPKCLAVDWMSVPSKLYVCLVPLSGIGKIIRCNTDGSNVEDVVTGRICNSDIELDLTHRKIYWLEDTWDDDQIWKADMDSLNSGMAMIYRTTVTSRDLWGLALDVVNDRLWITERGSTCYSSYIKRMSLSGANVTIIRNPVCNPHDIEYSDDKIYWGDGFGLLKANADGSGVDTLGREAAAIGLALDRNNGRIYWTDYSANNIRRVDFSGANEMEVFGSVGQFYGIDIDLNPASFAEERAPRLPSSIALFQNYPNPFNAETVIRYRLPAAQEITISIYDIYGRQVAVLASGTIEAGDHQVRFEGRGLSAGVYFCRLQSEGAVVAQKLLLLK